MYLDALDGEDILGGAENGWHYGSKFVFEIWKRLKKPALMEMSTFHHHLWCVRSRMGAWDHPNRSHKRFIDIHCAGERGQPPDVPARRTWAGGPFKTWTGPQGEPTFADDIEYLCGKASAPTRGFSLMGIDPDNVREASRAATPGGDHPALRGPAPLRKVPESVKAQLRVPGDEFTLVGSRPRRAGSSGRSQYAKHKVESAAPMEQRVEGDQQVRRAAAAAADRGPDVRRPLRRPRQHRTLADFADASGFPRRAPSHRRHGDSASRRTTRSRSARPAAAITATSTPARRRTGAWASCDKTFTPPQNLSGAPGAGLWVHGDGQGEVLNLQLNSPPHLVARHRRSLRRRRLHRLALLRADRAGGRAPRQLPWPYGDIYSIYRETVDYKQIEKFSLWVNNLPARAPRPATLSPVRATSLVKAKSRTRDSPSATRTLAAAGRDGERQLPGVQFAGGLQSVRLGWRLPSGRENFRRSPAAGDGRQSLRFGCDQRHQA